MGIPYTTLSEPHLAHSLRRTTRAALAASRVVGQPRRPVKATSCRALQACQVLNPQIVYRFCKHIGRRAMTTRACRSGRQSVHTELLCYLVSSLFANQIEPRLEGRRRKRSPVHGPNFRMLRDEMIARMEKARNGKVRRHGRNLQGLPRKTVQVAGDDSCGAGRKENRSRSGSRH